MTKPAPMEEEKDNFFPQPNPLLRSGGELPDNMESEKTIAPD